jgi:hypothetical protein
MNKLKSFNYNRNMDKEFDVKRFEELVNQIKDENPKIDIELCKYIAGSYLLYDVMGIEKPTDEHEQFKKANQIISDLSVEIEA